MSGYYEKAVICILDGKNKTNNQNRTEIEVCRGIQRTLGIRKAAGYLRNRGWSIEAALYILCGK